MAKLIPAILTDDPVDLEKKMREVEEWTDEAHIDFMDGEFVETISVPPESLTAANPTIDLEAHLMVKRPDLFVAPLKDTRVKRIIFHADAVDNRDFLIRLFKDEGFSVGLAINPESSIDVLSDHLSEVDLIHFLTVDPGKQGNPFQPKVLEKIRELRKRWPSGTISADGGIKTENIDEVVSAGVERITVGSSIWQAEDPKNAYLELKEKLQ